MRELTWLSLMFALMVACKSAAPVRPSFGVGTGNARPDPETGDSAKGDPETDDPETDDPEAETNDPENETSETKVPETKIPDTFDVAIEKVEAKNPGGQAAIKGETAVFKLNVKNVGSKSGKVKLTPYISAKNYTDYENIKLPSFELSLNGQESKAAEFKIEPFFKEDGGNREYGLNKGEYVLRFKAEGDSQKELKEFNGKDFKIAGSRAVFTAVYWSQQYLDKARYGKGIDDWLRESFTRKGQTSNGADLFASYDGGFDQMMNVKTMWKTFPNWRPDQNQMDKILDQVSAEGQRRLGLKEPFKYILGGKMTHPDNHGYDMEIGLTENGFGGVAWMGGNTQASGIFDGDTSVGRSQMVLIHETGHNYGAPHCDPIQGFIMCSGEKHDHYTNGEGWFVWHDVSIKEMVKANNMENDSSNFNVNAFAGDMPFALTPSVARKIHN